MSVLYGAAVGDQVPFSVSDRKHIARRFDGRVPLTSAVPVLKPRATRRMWHEERRHGIGASELAAVNNIPGAYGSAFSLWWSKRSGEVLDGTEQMDVGSRMESVIGDLWLERNPEAMLFRPWHKLYGSPETEWLICTPDYLAVVRDVESCTWPPDECAHHEGACSWPVVEPVECKAYEGGAWGEPGTDQVPPHIEVQVAVQCHVMGARRGHVARLHNKRFTQYTIAMDADRTARLEGWLQTGEEFMASLAADAPPPLDASPWTESALQKMFPEFDPEQIVYFGQSEVDEYVSALEAMRKAKHQRQVVVNMIRQRLGNAGVAVGPDERPFAVRQISNIKAYKVKPRVQDAIQPRGRKQ